MKQGLIVFVPSMTQMEQLTVPELEKLHEGLSKVYANKYLEFSILVLWPSSDEPLALSQRLMVHEALDKIEQGYYDEFEIVGGNQEHPQLSEFLKFVDADDVQIVSTQEKTELQRILYA